LKQSRDGLFGTVESETAFLPQNLLKPTINENMEL